MYMDKEEYLESLYNEAAVTNGMIAEVKAKARLSANRLKDYRESGKKPPQELKDEMSQSILRMRADLAKYRRRLEEIGEELNEISEIYDVP